MEGEQYIIHLDTLLLINSCIDRQVQWPSYPHIAFNNTYGIQTVNESVYNNMMDAYSRSGGCRDQIDACRAVSAVYDPDNIGLNATVNQVCAAAETFCSDNLRAPYNEISGRNYYDLTQLDPDPFPYEFFQGWLNQPVSVSPCPNLEHNLQFRSRLHRLFGLCKAENPPLQHVQSALGVPLNFTSSSSAVSQAFRSIGDYPRPGWLEDLSYLLERGIKVAMMYGDRDYACAYLCSYFRQWCCGAIP